MSFVPKHAQLSFLTDKTERPSSFNLFYSNISKASNWGSDLVETAVDVWNCSLDSNCFPKRQTRYRVGISSWTFELDFRAGFSSWTFELNFRVGLSSWTSELDFRVWILSWTFEQEASADVTADLDPPPPPFFSISKTDRNHVQTRSREIFSAMFAVSLIQ